MLKLRASEEMRLQLKLDKNDLKYVAFRVGHSLTLLRDFQLLIIYFQGALYLNFETEMSWDRLMMPMTILWMFRWQIVTLKLNIVKSVWLSTMLLKTL